MDEEYTPDGYRIVKLQKPIEEKGVQCATCGMRFENNKQYSYSCFNTNCPIFYRTSLK